MDDAEDWVHKVLAGDTAHYRPVVEAHRVPVSVLIAAIVPDLSLVDDLVHETFITAYLKLREYQPGTDFRSWVKAIARNIALKERRRWLRTRRRESFQALVEDSGTAFVDQVAEAIDSDTVRKIHECLSQLADGAKRVVEQRYFQGLDSREIAEREKRTRSWVRIVLLRARAALAGCLAGKGLVPDA